MLNEELTTSEYATEIGEKICEYTKIAFKYSFKYLSISCLCGIGATVGFLIVYLSFLSLGGLEFIMHIIMDSADVLMYDALNK